MKPGKSIAAGVQLTMRHSFLSRGMDLDSPETVAAQGTLIRSKWALRQIYLDPYRFMAAQSDCLPKGAKVELGSGCGFIADVIPDTVTTDYLLLSNTDAVLSAQALPFKGNSISALYMHNVMHHLPQVRQFFAESTRVLLPGGKIILIEPASTPWSRFVYKTFHHEPFDPDTPNWEFGSEGSPLSSANGALASLVFVRDRARFESEFPSLRITHLEYCDPLRYLLSGGVSRLSLLPRPIYCVLHALEKGPLRRVLPWTGMFMRVVLTKM